MPSGQLAPTMLEPLRFDWHIVHFIDELFDVSDLGTFGDAAQCEILPIERVWASVVEES